jgi:hypothetical protein
MFPFEDFLRFENVEKVHKLIVVIIIRKLR